MRLWAKRIQSNLKGTTTTSASTDEVHFCLELTLLYHKLEVTPSHTATCWSRALCLKLWFVLFHIETCSHVCKQSHVLRLNFWLVYYDNSKILTLNEHESHTGEYWPRVVAEHTQRSEVCAKTTEGQYSPEWLELARLVSCLLHGTRGLACFESAGFRKQNIHLKTTLPYNKYGLLTKLVSIEPKTKPVRSEWLDIYELLFLGVHGRSMNTQRNNIKSSCPNKLVQ